MLCKNLTHHKCHDNAFGFPVLTFFCRKQTKKGLGMKSQFHPPSGNGSVTEGQRKKLLDDWDRF